MQELNNQFELILLENLLNTEYLIGRTSSFIYI